MTHWVYFIEESRMLLISSIVDLVPGFTVRCFTILEVSSPFAVGYRSIESCNISLKFVGLHLISYLYSIRSTWLKVLVTFDVVEAAF